MEETSLDVRMYQCKQTVLEYVDWIRKVQAKVRFEYWFHTHSNCLIIEPGNLSPL
jgi:hypothetical protein